MRKIVIALLVSLGALPAQAAAPIALPDGLTLPAGLTVTEQSKLRDYDWTGIAYPPQKGEKNWSHINPAGQTWWLYLKGPGKKSAELDTLMRSALKTQGWEILTTYGLIVARRKLDGKQEWLSGGFGDGNGKLTVIIEVPAPTLSVPEPKPTPETFGDADDFPYLGHFPGAKLASTRVASSGSIRAFADGVKPESFAGPPLTTKSYTMPSGYAPLELVTIYKSALEKAGWTILHTAVGGDGVVSAHYAKGERDIYCYLHDATFQVADVGAASEAKKLADMLARDGHIAIYGIYFDPDKDVLKPESEAALRHILELLHGNAKLALEVQGHTDDVGDAAHNQQLSEKRAAAVKTYLVGKGIAASRLTTKGFGASKPLGDNKTSEGRAKNRRVELAKP